MYRSHVLHPVALPPSDRRPAFAQVSHAAISHDEAMLAAAVAQRRLEAFDSRALPVDLLRQVINQRFRALENRVRDLERALHFGEQTTTHKPSPENRAAAEDPRAEATTVASRVLSFDDTMTKSSLPPPAPGPAAPFKMVQEWRCELRTMRRSAEPAASLQNVVAVWPILPRVSVDPDPEFNAIHQRRSDKVGAEAFARFLVKLLRDKSPLGGTLISLDATAGSAGDTKTEPESPSLSDQQGSWVDRVLWAQGDPLCLADVTANKMISLSEHLDIKSAVTGRSSISFEASFRMLLVGGEAAGELSSESPKVGGTGGTFNNQHVEFASLLSVIEGLSASGFYVRLHAGDAGAGTVPTKRVEVFAIS